MVSGITNGGFVSPAHHRRGVGAHSYAHDCRSVGGAVHDGEA